MDNLMDNLMRLYAVTIIVSVTVIGFQALMVLNAVGVQ